MRDVAVIVAALADAAAHDEPVVLATVVRTDGSTYRRAGARMLVHADGRTAGAVSGGCLESDIMARVDGLLAARRPEIVSYSGRSADEPVWGLGAGCNGRVDVLLEPLLGDALTRALALHVRCSDLTERAALTTVIGTSHTGGTGGAPEARVGDRLMLTSDDELVSFGIDPEAVSPELIEDAKHARTTGESTLCEYGATRRGAPRLELFHEAVIPPLSLWIYGAGADAGAVVRAAAQLGWRVTIVDHRPEMAAGPRFPGVTVRRDARGTPSSEVPLGCDAAVVMAHDFELDSRRVRALLAADLPYVGVLGPRERTERMLEGLDLDHAATARLYAPVGLDVGAETPEEIALAIIAEVQAVKAGRRGASLRERAGRIHGQGAGVRAPVREGAPVDRDA